MCSFKGNFRLGGIEYSCHGCNHQLKLIIFHNISWMMNSSECDDSFLISLVYKKNRLYNKPVGKLVFIAVKE